MGIWDIFPPHPFPENREHLQVARYIRLHLSSLPKFSGLIIYTLVVQVVES